MNFGFESIMMRKLLCSVLLLTAALPALADTPYLEVFLGQIDLGRPQADSQYGLQFQSDWRLTRYDLIPMAGVMRTRYGSHYVYTGLARVTPFSAGEGGLSLALSFAPGLYWHGGNADTDLGYPVQFQSSVGIHYDFPDATRIGLHFSHLSNASLADTNPGTEALTLRYGLPF